MANPRITFHAPSKTFDRLLKERSLSDLKEAVRKKLGLGSGSVVQFSQLRNGQLVDLEDEDDFDAFYAIVNEQRHATIQVTLTESFVTEGSSVGAKGSTSPLPALLGYGRLPANSSAFILGGVAPHKKVVPRNKDGIEGNLETLTTTPPTPSVIARQNLPSTPTRKRAPIRTETPEQRQKRLEEEEQKEKEDKAKEELKRKEEEEKERLKKEEEEKELSRQEQEEEEKERLRKEDEARELRRKEKKQKKMERLRREKEEKSRREQEEQNALTSTEASSPAIGPSPLPSIDQTSHHPPPSTQSSYVPYVPNARPQRHFFSQDSMSRSATTASKLSSQLPSKSAWSKGPPQRASAPFPRSQSPAPSSQPQTSHSRRPGALGQGVSTSPKSKFDVHELFQNPSSQPSNSSTSTETSSPATRPSPLPSQTSINQPSQHPPSSYTPFAANARPQQPHQQQNTGPGSGPPPRSAYPRQLNGTNTSNSQVPPAMSSPRLGAHPSSMPPPPPPPMSAQMQPPVPWPGYYYPGAEHQHQHYMQTYPGWNWAPPQMSPATQHPHQYPHISGVPMSPRTHAPPLQSPGTPTLSHAAAAPLSHPPPPISHAPSSSMSSMLSPPPMPASALPDGPLKAKSSAFVPGGAAPRKKVVLRNKYGIEVSLETLATKVSRTPPTSVTARPNLPARKTAPIRIETLGKRLKKEEQKKEAKAKASAEKREEEEERRKELQCDV